MTESENWFKSLTKTHLFKTLSNHPVAYFCAEFALDFNMPTYAGGLGVLAGDLVREAHDREIPLVGIGLYYHRGYTRQKFYNQKQLDHIKDPANLGLKLVRDKTTRKPILVKIPMQDRDVFAVAWLWDKGTVPVYLLDANINENIREDQLITQSLYDADLQTRLKQEILLGIGGYRLIQTLGIQPSIYHMNEGHSAFLALEVISNIMRTLNVGFEQAREIAKKNIVFTNHTLVAAGHDNFVNDLVSLVLERYAQQIKVPISELVSMGLVKNSDIFSMTMLSLRSAGGINAVSQLHAKKANEVWTNHQMIAITNGIHIPSWDMVADQSQMWKSHQKNKKKLLEIINKSCKQKWKEDELLIGWARRVVGYKRPLAIFSDIKRIQKIARNKDRPVNIFFAGLYHSDDQEGVDAVNAVKKLAAKELRGNLSFIDDYNTDLARNLTSGADIWLNTPVVGFEACGTSGMKAALNGVLNFSTKDGWFYEVGSSEIGWEIDDKNIKSSIYDILENEIVPMYYDDGRITEFWIKKMETARSLIQDNFSATRMLRDYIEKIYLKLI